MLQTPTTDPTQQGDGTRFMANLHLPENRKIWEEINRQNRVSTFAGAWAMARQWLVIGLAVTVASRSYNPWLVGLAIVIISTRQHALGILVHDATHYRILANRRANDFFCDLLCAFPVNMTVARYRHEHILHHRHNGTDGDPYWRDWQADDHWHWPKSWKSAAWLFVKDLLSLNMIRLGPVVHRWSPWANHFSRKNSPPPLTCAERLRLYLFWGTLAGLLTWTHSWLPFLLLWVLPATTLTVLWLRIRSAAEHLGLPHRGILSASRHVDARLWERLTISPLNINYHLDHHLFPTVPFYNLPKLHQILLKIPEYRNESCRYESYFGGENSAYREMITWPKTQASHASPEMVSPGA